MPLRCQYLLLRLMRFKLTRVGLSGHISDQKLEEIRQQMMEDDEIRGVAECTFSVWLRNGMDIPYSWINISERIECCQRVGASCILLLTITRSEMMNKIRAGHLGVTKSHKSAKQGVWWLDLSREISKLIPSRDHCQKYWSSQLHEPLMPTELTDSPWQHVGADMLTYKGKEFLVMLDGYSPYVTSSYDLHYLLSPWLWKWKISARYGTPQRSSDNSPQFSSDTFVKLA